MSLIIDEKKARKMAKNFDIKIIGLLGIIYLNAKRGRRVFLQKCNKLWL